MADTIGIPKITDTDFDRAPGAPGWVQPVKAGGELCKPIIRCNCGVWVGIGLHHVHSDGTVTASFFHSQGEDYKIGQSPEGCGWHVMLKLLDYTGGEFPPDANP